MPHPASFLAAALSTLSGVVPVPAAGATPWTPPVSVGPGDMELFRAVAGDAGGVLVAGYGTQGVDLQPVATAARGRFRRTTDVVDVGAYGSRAVFLRSTRGARRIAVSVGDLAARDLGRPRTLHRGAPASAVMAVGASGELLVALGVGRRDDALEFDDERVRLSWSTVERGRRRWRSLPLPGRTDVLAAAVDPRGTAVLLLQRPDGTGTGYRVVARTLALFPGRLSPERLLGRTRVDDLDGAVATNGTGDAVVAWGAQDGGEEADHPYVVRAAVRRRGSTRFRPTQTLDPGDAAERPGGWPVAAIDDEGTATVGWTQAVDLDSWVPRAATAPAGRPFGRRRDLLPSGTVGDAVARGTTTLVSVDGSHDAPGADGEPPAASLAGVVSRSGADGPDVFEPIATPSRADVDAPLLTAGPTGFAAVWAGAAGRRAALRYAVRPVG